LVHYYCSARMWMLSCQPQNFTNQAANIDNVDIIPKLTLFGHSARIWDCYISDSVSLLFIFSMLSFHSKLYYWHISCYNVKGLFP
jgi:hypothetical protein